MQPPPPAPSSEAHPHLARAARALDDVHQPAPALVPKKRRTAPQKSQQQKKGEERKPMTADKKAIMNHLMMKAVKTDRWDDDDLALFDVDDVQDLIDLHENDEGIVPDKQLKAHYKDMFSKAASDQTWEESVDIDKRLDDMMQKAGVNHGIAPITLPSLIYQDTPKNASAAASVLQDEDDVAAAAVKRPPVLPPVGKDVEVANALAPSTSDGAKLQASVPRGLLEPPQLDLSKYNKLQLRFDLPPDSFLDPSRRQHYMMENSVRNLQQHLIKMKVWRREQCGRKFMGRGQIEAWQMAMRPYTSELVTELRVGNRLVFVFYVERPIFVYCVFEVTGEAEECLEWISHFYVQGKEVVPPRRK